MYNTVDNCNQIQSRLSNKCRDFFNDEWKLYQKILDNNYMQHQDIYGAVHNFIVDNWQQESLRILDIGCGDASLMSRTLLNTNVSFYCALDISDTAISIAQENMRSISCDQKFIQGDFCQEIPLLPKEEKDQFNLIITSFAFHHLSLEKKDYVLDQLKQLLSPEGIFIMIDLVCKNNESRDICIEKYLQTVKKEWLQLSFEELKLISNHMWNSDYPETIKTIETFAHKNGLKLTNFLSQKEDDAQVILFEHLENSTAII
jgi:cyclopropane fatty-acyl-phospholipid synthase-like methyltransferase